MVSIYHWENGALREVDKLVGSCWINLSDPSTQEIQRIHELSGAPSEFITDPLDKDERPRIETDDGITQFIVHVPCYDPSENVTPFHTLPMGIVLTKNHVLTICNRQTPVTSTFLDQIRRVCSPEHQFRFVFQILWHSAVLYLRYLRDLRQRADIVEQDLHESVSNEALMRLMNIEKSLVYFTTSLKANNILIQRLEHSRQLAIPENDLDVLEDVQVEYEQALEMATIHSNILSGTLDTFASIVSNNLNKMMKRMNSITVIIMVPTLVASIYGMNIELPFQHEKYIFSILMLLSLMLAGGTVYLLARKRFF